MKTDEELIDEIVKATSELYPLDYAGRKPMQSNKEIAEDEKIRSEDERYK